MLPCASLEFNISNSINGIKISSFLTSPYPEITIGCTGLPLKSALFFINIVSFISISHLIFSFSYSRPLEYSELNKTTTKLLRIAHA